MFITMKERNPWILIMVVIVLFIGTIFINSMNLTKVKSDLKIANSKNDSLQVLKDSLEEKVSILEGDIIEKDCAINFYLLTGKK